MESMEAMYNELNESWWFHGGFMVQAPKDEAKSSEELDPDTDDSTRPDKPIRRSAKDKDNAFELFHQFFSILCLLLTLSIFLYVFSFTCNTHGLGAVL